RPGALAATADWASRGVSRRRSVGACCRAPLGRGELTPLVGGGLGQHPPGLVDLVVRGVGEGLELLLLLGERCKIGFRRMLEGSEVRLGLLVVLKCRVLILADLLHSGYLAEESLSVRGDEELCGGVEASVLELRKGDLTHLKLHPGDLVGLHLDVSLLQLQLGAALLDLFSDTGVLLVDGSRISLQLCDPCSRLRYGQRWIGRSRQDEQRGQCHGSEPKRRDTYAPQDRCG